MIATSTAALKVNRHVVYNGLDMYALIRAVLVGLVLGAASISFAGSDAWAIRYGSTYESWSQPEAELLQVDPVSAWNVLLDAPFVTADGGTAYMLVGGGLMAIEVASGEVIWRSLANLTGPLLATPDGVFAAAGDTIVKLDVRTGRVLWQRQLEHQEIQSLTRQGDLILAMGRMWYGGDLLDSHTGQVVYSFSITDNSWPVYLDESLLYIREYSGEPHFYHAVLHDLELGAQRWRLGHSDGPIWRAEGRVYFVRQRISLRRPANQSQEIRVVDELSGGTVDAWEYSTGDVKVRLSDFAPHYFMNDNEVAILSGTQDMVFGFPWGGSNEPAWAADLGGHYRAGPVSNLIFAESHDGRLIATMLPGGESYELLGAGPAFARIQLLGELVYAAREDGTLYITTTTGEVQARLQLGAKIAGPIMIEDNRLLVQLTNTLQVYELENNGP